MVDVSICIAFRDGGVGPGANRRRPTDDAPRGGSRGGRGARARGGEIASTPLKLHMKFKLTLVLGRGATHHRNADDRHTKNVAP